MYFCFSFYRNSLILLLLNLLSVSVCYTGLSMQPAGVSASGLWPELSGGGDSLTRTATTLKPSNASFTVHINSISDYKCYPEVKGMKFIKSKCWIQRIKVCCSCVGGGVLHCGGGTREIYVGENVCSADRLQTKHIIFWYALLFIASISCSQCVIRWHVHQAET